MLAVLLLARIPFLAAGAMWWGCAHVPSQGAATPTSTKPVATDRRARFGFRGMEILKVGDGASGLVAGDFDGDGLGDLALIDNRRSRVEVLRRLPAGAPDAPDPDEKPRDKEGRGDSANVLSYSGRFARRRYPVERRVLQLACGDWNGDKKDDLAWVAEGGELTVLWSDPKGGEPREEKRTLDLLRNGCVGLVAADFDHDGRTDLVAASPSELLGLPSGEKGLGDPVSLDQFETAPTRVFLVDLDGKAGGDLLYAYANADAPLRYRLAGPAGFGPRIDLEMPQMRSFEVVPAANPPGTDVLAIFKLSGRLSELAFAPLEAGRRALRRHALRKGGERGEVKRSFACADLDGDGAADVLVAEPEDAALSVFWGTKGAGGLVARSYPSLSGASSPKVADLAGDGKREVLCISAGERMLGVARLSGQGRDLGFPTTYPIDGEPAALDVADLDGDGRADAVVLVAQGEGRARKHRLEIRAGKADGSLSPPKVCPLEGLKKTPYALRMIDLDRDGKLDALAFEPGEKAVPTLILSRDGSFVADERGEDAPGLGILAGVGPDSIAVADVDGDGKPELLVAQANFVRALAFDAVSNAAPDSAPDSAPRNPPNPAAGGRLVPRVVAQFNAPAPDARLSAVAFADWDADGRPDLIVRDEATREIQALGRSEKGGEGAWHVLERASTARLEFAGLATADFDGDGRPDLVVYGHNEIGLLRGGGQESGFEERASYDPKEEHVILDQIEAADLGGDARQDVVVSELRRHALAILEREGSSLVQALGFEVFEKKSFEDQNPEREPRELRSVDVDGDGKTDLVLLVHDKLIVYLQE
jgi:hypothetical protein